MKRFFGILGMVAAFGSLPSARASLAENALAKVPFDSTVWSYQSSAPLALGKVGLFAHRGTDAIVTLVEDHSGAALLPDVREEVYCKQLARSFHEKDFAACRHSVKFLHPTLKAGKISVGIAAHEENGDESAGIWVFQLTAPKKFTADQRKKLDQDFETLVGAFKRGAKDGKSNP